MFAAKKLQGAAGAAGEPTWDLDYAYYDDPYAGDLSTAAYASKSFSVASQDTFPVGVFFKPDGTKMYVNGISGGDLNEYTLSTAWDVSSASYVRNYVLQNACKGVWFKPDGTKFYVSSPGADLVYQHSCSTAWNLSTASYDSVSFSTLSQDGQVSGLQFSEDGTKFFIMGINSKRVYQYSCSTAWNLSTASYSGKSFSVSGQVGSVANYFGMSGDGTKMYAPSVNGTGSDVLYQYNLSTAWDISTASYASKAFSTYGTNGYGMFVRQDGGGFYQVSDSTDTIYQYVMGGFSVSAQDATPEGFAFKPDGTKFYMAGTTNDRIYQYSLSTAWDLSTALYDSKNVSVSAYATSPVGLVFKPDGTELYVPTYNPSDRIVNYTLSTPWDVSTATYTKYIDVSGTNDLITGLDFSSDGTKMVTCSQLLSTTNEFNSYTLSTAWDIATASWNSTYNLGSSSPAGLSLNDDGTKIFAKINHSMQEFDLSTAYDVSTASLSKTIYAPFRYGLYFSDDGTKFYINGFFRIMQYSIGNQ